MVASSIVDAKRMNRHEIVKIERLEDYDRFDEIIDVRSPAEFAEDHIPGAINCPVLDNEQRVEVGTLYKQESPFAAKKIGAAYVAENIARHLRQTFHDRPPSWRPLIVCWRGGQRSGSLTLILRRIGWDAQQLQGGYKDYRQLVIAALAELPRRFHMQVICGPTGSAKSRVLQALATTGEQILDLEELANHKGSVLGLVPGTRQPSQKMFETHLLAALRQLDPSRPLYVEAESRRIGSIHVPDALLETMRASACVYLEADFTARVDYLLRDYAYFLDDPVWLNTRLEALRPLQGHQAVSRWHDYVARGAWRELVSELLEIHYDPLYRRSQQNSYAGLKTPTARHVSCNDLADAGIAELARRIAGHGPRLAARSAAANGG